MFSVPSMERLALAMEDTVAAVMGMHAAHAEAVEDLVLTRYQLETQKAKLVAEGIEGKNAEQRDAQLRLLLSNHYEALHYAELAVERKSRDLTLSRLQLDGLRYHLRIAEVTVRLSENGNVA
jgi:hypothetical protein